MKRIAKLILLCPILLVPFFKSASAATFSWSEATVMGSGCTLDNTVTERDINGGVTWRMRGLRINLTGSGGPQSEMKNCRFSVPMKAPGGYWLKSFSLTLPYRVQNSDEKNILNLSATSDFKGIQLLRKEKQFSSPGFSNSKWEIKEVFQDQSAWCGSGDFPSTGIFKLNISLTGLIQERNESASLLVPYVQSNAIKLQWARCGS